MSNQEVFDEIDKLEGFLLGDADVSPGIRTRIKGTVELIAKNEGITLGEAYYNFINSPVYQYITRKTDEAIGYNAQSFYQVYKLKEEQRKKTEQQVGNTK